MGPVVIRMGAFPGGRHEGLSERLQGAGFRTGGSWGAIFGGDGQPHAPLLQHPVVQSGVRAVGAGIPTVSTVDRRADLGLHAGLGPQHVFPFAGGHIITAGPILGF